MPDSNKYLIKKLDINKVTFTNGKVYTSEDIIIDAFEVTKWDWDLTGLRHFPGYTEEQQEKLLKFFNVPLNSKIIMSTGVDEKIQCGEPILNVIFMPSYEAVQYYNEQVKCNNSVVLFLHTTCLYSSQ